MSYTMKAGATITAPIYEYTPTKSAATGQDYYYSNPYEIWNPVQPKPVSTPKYTPYNDPMSNSYMGGGWEDDPSIFGSGGLLGALRPFDFVPDNGWYDPQLDDLSRTDPLSVPGSGIDPKQAEEDKKTAAKNGGATNTPPKKEGDGGGTQGGGGGNPPVTNDGPESRPWWHWALLAGAGGLGVWYLMKKKKKGKK